MCRFMAWCAGFSCRRVVLVQVCCPACFICFVCLGKPHRGYVSDFSILFHALVTMWDDDSTAVKCDCAIAQVLLCLESAMAAC